MNDKISHHSQTVAREMAGSRLLLGCFMSMARVWLEYAKSMPRVCQEYVFVRRERTLSTSRANSQSVGHGLRFLRYVAVLILMFLGIGEMWGQPDYSGINYIASEVDSYDNENTRYGSTNSTTATHCYLVPAEKDGTASELAYYTAGNAGKTKPYITTFKTGQIPNSIWIFQKTGDYYHIIHALTGKYLVYAIPSTSQNNPPTRRVVHLEDSPDLDNNNTKFDITFSSDKNCYYFSPSELSELADTQNKFLNVCNHNKGQYYATATSAKQNSEGLIGKYSDPDNSGDVPLSRWHLEDATLAASTITISDMSSDNKVTITAPDWLPAGYNIRYTFSEGTPTDPTASTTTYIVNTEGSANEIEITEPGTLKVVIERYGVVLSEVATKIISKVATPSVINDGTNITINCATDGATIYYTMDGSNPLTSDTKQTYSAPLLVSDYLDQTINAIAVKVGCFNSEMSDPLLVKARCPMPTISYSNSNGEITLECSEAGATIYYTLDGTAPDPTQVGGSYPTKLYDSAAKPTISATTTVKAIATKAGSDDSEVASLTIVLNPTITLEGTPYTYDGTAKEPTVSSVKDGETAIDPSEYTVSYSNNTNAGTATVTITDNDGGAYYVAGSTTFTINPFSIGSGTTPATGISIDVSKSGDDYVVTVKHGETTLTKDTDYTLTTSSDEYSYTATVTGIGNYTGSAQAIYIAVVPGNYVLHQNGKGYLKVSGANVTLANDENLQYADLYNNGNAFWVITEQGYLQNNVYYLNVAPESNELYLSVKPVTRWSQEDIGDTHGKKHVKYGNLYLCNKDNKITLSDTPTGYYNACPVTITEKSWSGPTNGDLNVQSPQLVTYLRYYFTQKIDYEFYDDSGTKKNESDKDRYVYAKLEYVSGGDNKGSKWNITDDGVIYNMQTSDVAVTATYKLLPADAEALKLSSHSTAVEKSIKLTIKPRPFTPDAKYNYLLFSISGNTSHRYPFDDGIAENSPVKSNGPNTVLTDPANDQISWVITTDETGSFYHFKNVSSGRYLYYDESLGDYGKVCVGANTLPTGDDLKKYKFRLFSTTHNDFGTCYFIIPYDKLFAVYLNNQIATNLYSALNVKYYKSGNYISLRKSDGDSQWCIYKYEMEYRLSGNFSIQGETTVSETGNYSLTAKTFYHKRIKESPTKASVERALEINGTYDETLNYPWTVTGLDGYATSSFTPNPCTGTSTLTINVTSLPVSSVSGVVEVNVRGGDNNDSPRPRKWQKKSVPFTILGNGAVTLTNITSLSAISSSSGAYKLTADQEFSSSNKPAAATSTFSGILDCDGHTISGLTAPLFETLTNGTVSNVNLSEVNITSHSGPTGAIAGTANGGSRIYNVGILGGSVGSSDDVCGGLVGKLDGSARVINCFSYANITSGTTVGGIVGENKYKTTAIDARTMVMNCMFYGDIDNSCTSKAPIYNGEIISNVGDNGVGNYNYFWSGASYVKNLGTNDKYNCALAADTRYLQRFEFFRHLLNGHRNLAAWWVTNDYTKKGEMKKWVMEPSQIGTTSQFPILGTPGQYYPSVVNIDADHAEEFSNDATIKKTQRNQGRKFGSLTINIQLGSDGDGDNAPKTAKISTDQVTANITDKDPEHFNFNYYKVQLPYYNDVGEGNYTKADDETVRVVTGWKIVEMSKTTGSFTTGDEASAGVDDKGNITLTTPYNFADRNSTAKDIYSSTNKRVFNQGAYFDVPEGVTSITIEPYWGKAVFLADAYADVVYDKDMKNQKNVPNIGGGARYTDGSTYSFGDLSLTVYTTLSNAITALSPSGTVYDNAIVLVGNYHHYSNGGNIGGSNPYTLTAIDLDNDNEPDYSYIMRFDGRTKFHPLRYDFLNLVGLGMAQKSTGGTGSYNFGIMQPVGWFETTNTSLFRVTQFEYDQTNRTEDPLILQGGIIEQWVSGQSGGYSNKTTYFHVGGNVWFKEFHRGTHQDQTYVSKHPPVSVTGGDFDEFYLTGLYRGDVNNFEDDAECYINGGRFGIVAGAGMEGIGKKSDHTKGNIYWQIQNADINEFYAGGINAAHPIEGSIYNVISGGYIKQFCGGPKFGDMSSGKTVTTNAENCIFDTYFGAGYGGNSYSRRAPGNQNNKINIDWNSWVATEYTQEYNATYDGVDTQFKYQFLPMSGNADNVCRLFVEYVKFSLATTRGVTSKLNGCTINNNFYGGGSLGKVDGSITSTLDGCKVKGNVFGAGYSALLPSVEVMPKTGFITEPDYDEQTGNFSDGVFPSKETNPSTTTYTWEHAETVNSTETAINTGTNKLFTTENLEKSNLGSVAGNVTLTIKGNSVIGTEGDTTGKKGNVFGGGESSYVTGDDHTVTVNIQGNTEVLGNVFGGGDNGVVEGSTEVKIEPEPSGN